MSVVDGTVEDMGQYSLAHVGLAAGLPGLGEGADLVASWLKSCQAVGLVVSTSQTSVAEKEAVRELSRRLDIRSAWAHSVGTGPGGKDLDALVVVAPDAELLDWVAAECDGAAPRVVVVLASAAAVRALSALGSVDLRTSGVRASEARPSGAWVGEMRVSEAGPEAPRAGDSRPATLPGVGRAAARGSSVQGSSVQGASTLGSPVRESAATAPAPRSVPALRQLVARARPAL